jgi:hypothetical protein
LSTRVSEKSSRELREYARRTGKSLGEVLDDILAFAASQPAFEAYMTELDAARRAFESEPGAERTRTTVVVTKSDGVAAIEVTLAGPEPECDPTPSDATPFAAPSPFGLPLAGVPLATENPQ